MTRWQLEWVLSFAFVGGCLWLATWAVLRAILH